MLRLFGGAGLLTLLSAGMALATGSLIFRVLTLLFGCGIIALYLYLRRGLPNRHTNLRVAGLREPVDVHWDDRGVPHIYARNLHDLYLAQGYVTAQDRLWSMDLTRRAAAGRLAELFGPAMLGLDKHYRSLGLHKAAAESVALHTAETQEALAAYAEGVNACIAEGRLSPEFALLRHKPEPWTPTDTLALVRYAGYGLGGNWGTELFRARLAQAVGADKAAELFWLPPDMEVLRQLEEMPLPDLNGLLEIAATTPTGGASNGWVVAGSRTKSGAPILANDPHLSMRNPSLWYQSHLIGPDGLDVAGVTFPGVPGIVAGHNRDIAWGLSGIGMDLQDVYIEKRNPAAPDQYRYEGRWEKAITTREEIRVRGHKEPVYHEVHVTRHGPVLTGDHATALTLRWTGLEPSSELDAILAIGRARSWSEFKQALEQNGAPAHTFLFAGRDGTIASKAAGRVPVRSKGTGQAPMPGWTGECEWRGYVPAAELPECVNPASGVITQCRTDDYRPQWIERRLQGSTNLTVEKMQALQLDCTNVQAGSLLQIMLSAVQEGLRQGPHPETLSDTEKRALLLLSGWDCGEGPDAPEPSLWHQWYLFLVEEIFRPQLGLALFDQFMACGMALQVADRVIRQVAEGGDSHWLGREGEDGLSRLILRAFRRAVALQVAKHGANIERWRWGKERAVWFEHPLTMGRRWLQPFLNLGPYPVGGSAPIVHNTGYGQMNPFHVSVAAPWRFVIDFAAPEEAQEICAPGQSGHPLSPHHQDQLAAWLKGEYHVQVYRHRTIRDLHHQVLEPAP